MSGWSDADLVDLRHTVHEEARIESSRRATVAHLRQAGCPWSVIGEALGVTKQAAAKKYGSSRVAFEDRPLPL